MRKFSLGRVPDKKARECDAALRSGFASSANQPLLDRHPIKMGVCIVTFPLGEAGLTPVSHLVEIISSLARNVCLITGGAALADSRLSEKVQIVGVSHRNGSNSVTRIINYIRTQLKILLRTVAVSRRVDVFVFSIGGETLLIPMFIAKLLHKKIILIPAGDLTTVYSVLNDPLTKPTSLLVRLGMFLSDRLILYSRLLPQGRKMAWYRNKPIVAHEHFVDFDKFKVIRPIEERGQRVGYVGRLSEEKGILRFIDAISLVLKKRSYASFGVYGEGNLDNLVKRKIEYTGISSSVESSGWVPHEDVPKCLNEFALLVLPSFSEGLPNIILEAMACGTPVLATSVGAVPDIIEEGVTGFLLVSNDPQHISDKIVSILDSPEVLEKVSRNAYNYVRCEFSREKTVESWRTIFQTLEQ